MWDDLSVPISTACVAKIYPKKSSSGIMSIYMYIPVCCIAVPMNYSVQCIWRLNVRLYDYTHTNSS